MDDDVGDGDVYAGGDGGYDDKNDVECGDVDRDDDGDDDDNDDDACVHAWYDDGDAVDDVDVDDDADDDVGDDDEMDDHVDE